MLLNSDPAALARNLDAAERYGVNQLQLSHDLIMNVDDILGDDAESLAGLERLRSASDEADRRGIETLAWAHEFSRAGPLICYAPDDPIWQQRADAYRQALGLVPSLDGIVLMFGSADVPPWFTVCTCEWCQANSPGVDPFEAPPNDERIRIVTEQIGEAIVNEFGKRLVARTFVHEQAENEWHAHGFAAVEGVAFLGMHKSEVQDWQPHNPPDPTLGREGEHWSLVEMDVAGEYYGLSELPFCAPEYFAWRLDHARSLRAIGTALRIERGTHSALGTPNEVNLRAIADRLANPQASISASWDAYLGDAYQLAPGDPGRAQLERILADSFAIRLKSHYVLGIWALDKGSDLPAEADFGQLHDRGEMPKFDPTWQAIWSAVDRPDHQTVLWIWQEASEAVELAASGLAEYPELEPQLRPEDQLDLRRRLTHQFHAARAWRAAKLFLFADRARAREGDTAELLGWMAWARSDLAITADGLQADGLADVTLASPTRIARLLENTADRLPAGTAPIEPPTPLFSTLRTVEQGADRATVAFQVSRPVTVTAEWGLEIPVLDQRTELGLLQPGLEQRLEIGSLTPRQRYVLQLRADENDLRWRSGVHWIFTP